MGKKKRKKAERRRGAAPLSVDTEDREPAPIAWRVRGADGVARTEWRTGTRPTALGVFDEWHPEGAPHRLEEHPG